VARFELGPDLEESLASLPFDYLFSVANLSIIPDDILALPRLGAINFHDGPLPRYAGLHVTSWALMNREKEHGVTWHEMTAEVDAGDILKQRSVRISPDETALSLNVGCFQAGIQAFEELIQELEEDRVTPRPQEAREPHYFGKYKRPDAACVIPWSQAAEDICALVRALDFGPYPNPLGLPKLLFRAEVFYPPAMTVLDSASDQPPGSVVSIDDERLIVSTGTHDVAISQLVDFEGRSASVADLVDRVGVSTGDRLVVLDPETRDRLTELNGKICRHENYWIRRLSRLEDLSNPYCNSTRSPDGETHYSSVPITIPEGLDGEFVTAAFALYLARLSESDRYHIAFSTDALRRDLSGFESIFAVHVPVEVQVDSSSDAGSQLEAIRKRFSAAKRHITYPHDVLLRDPRLRSVVERSGRVSLGTCVERVDDCDRLAGPPAGQLALLLTDDASGCRLTYSTGAYSEENASRMQSQFSRFVHDIAVDSSRPVGEYSLVDADERQRILVEWNSTGSDYPESLCMHQLFEAQVERVPNKVAVVCEAERLSFQELNQQANQLAHWLRQSGVQAGTLVALCTKRSSKMLVGLLGVAKAGGAYVPLDPAFPTERLAYMLEDSGASVLITEEDLLPHLSERGVTVVCLDRDWPEIAQRDRENPPAVAGPNDLAYVIYTSGSTGRPKGVMIEHGSLVNFLTAMGRRPGLDEDDVLLSVTTISFDIAALELYLPLITGAQIVLASTEASRDGGSLACLLEESRASVMQATPATWQMLLDGGWKGSRLRMLCGGEALSRELAERLLGRGGQLWNLYGPTEATIWATVEEIRFGDEQVLIGRPIDNTQLYILDSQLQPVPVGTTGLLYIGGVQVARGYLDRPELTREKFLADPFCEDPGARLYNTGDLARYLPDGEVECLGRIDNQVKIRGFRVELGEIESALAEHPAVGQCVVSSREEGSGNKRLVGYIVPRNGTMPTASELKRFLGAKLADYMVPAAFVALETIPLTPNGKVDRRALPAPDSRRPELDAAYQMPKSNAEQLIAGVWQEVLEIEEIGVRDNFFELGGDSLLLGSVRVKLQERFGHDPSMVELFQYPTVGALAEHLVGKDEAGLSSTRRAERKVDKQGVGGADIAVIGLACRLPGAENAEGFWKNLERGIESVSFFSDDELRSSGVPSVLLEDPSYVRARTILSDIENFDAEFFGYSLREAEMMDPQHRLFLETAWEVLENAGYDPEAFEGAIGVYAGASMNSYILENLPTSLRDLGPIGAFQLMIGNDKDYLPTRVSYKLNLKGPSLNIQTACSTSLVAIHMACLGLRSGECDLALAGGVAAHVPQKAGYLFQEGMIASPDGHCRPFDARAGGTVFGSGVGAVVLKRMPEALEDGDCIRAVIKGSAVNNDGSVKVGYTAPSVDGQAEAIRKAQEAAGIDPETVTYVEAHGTATALGDPIEIAALTQAFRSGTQQRGFCGIGSVKSNIGHLDAAAGVAGFVKTVLALEHKLLPPSLHYEEPNLQIDFESTPFYVVTQPTEWKSDGHPRRAGVSSFGIGGTNCHVVLEESPTIEPPTNDPERPGNILTLSARSRKALLEAVDRHRGFLAADEEISLADVCFSANAGRRHFEHRLAVVAESTEQLRERLSAGASGRRIKGVISNRAVAPQPKIAFLFTGQGAQYRGMGREVYETQPTFRRELDRCAEILRPHLEQPLLEVLYSEDGASSLLDQTAYTQPALFALEYALAKLWQSWGIEPMAVMGHSVGEYVAACVAGVFSLEGGLQLIAERGRLMQSLPQDGDMYAVFADERRVAAVVERYRRDVSLASINGPSNVVISGRRAAVQEAVASLEVQGWETQKLNVSHSFHSPTMESIVGAFGQAVRRVSLSRPGISVISNVSGKPAAAEMATPEYWCGHIRQPVRFADSMASLIEQGYQVFLEIGPKPTLLGMGRECDPATGSAWIPSLRQGYGDWQQLLESLGELYVRGVSVDWSGFDRDYQRRRVPLPTYPFQRQRCWIEADGARQRRAERGSADAGEAFHRSSTGEGSSLLSGSAGQVTDGEEPRGTSAEESEILRGLETAPTSERLFLLTAHVETEVASTLGLDLSREPIDPQQSFTDMGMDSLLSIELRTRLQESLRVSLSPTFAFDSNVAALAKLLLAMISREDDAPADWTSVVPIQPDGTRAPFFFLSGSRNHFGDRLGPDQPVYRVVYQDLGREQPFVRIEEMAAYSIESVRRIQPEGPYHLGGHGLGGVVAFEIAQQLKRQGQQVATLVLCESRAPGSGASLPETSRVYRLWQRASYYLDRSRQVGPRQQVADLLRDVKANTHRAVSRAQASDRTRRRKAFRAAADEALERYAPQAYSGPITVVQCTEHPPWGYEDPLNGWGRFATGTVERYEVAGSHTGIYREPNVWMLATTLKDVLRKAQAGAESGQARAVP
jgi:amino acid adenylation domain-containing protein